MVDFSLIARVIFCYRLIAAMGDVVLPASFRRNLDVVSLSSRRSSAISLCRYSSGVLGQHLDQY
jgi:hypothetical protein